MPIVPTIQDSETKIQADRLSFPKGAQSHLPFRYYAALVGAGSNTEVFLNGVSGSRLGIPPDSSVYVFVTYSVFEYTTVTGAFVAGAGGFLNGLATNNNGTVALATNTTAVTDLIPDAGTTLTLAADDTNDSINLRCTTATAGSTYIVEARVHATVANKMPTIIGGVI